MCCVVAQLWKPVVLSGLTCIGRERNAPASPGKLAFKYLYERSVLKKKIPHRVRDGIPGGVGFKTTLFSPAVAVPCSHITPAVLEPILKCLACSIYLSS